MAKNITKDDTIAHKKKAIRSIGMFLKHLSIVQIVSI